MHTYRTLQELDAALLSAHEEAARDSACATLLVELYHQAYLLNLDDNPIAAYFYLTNAYVYALDTNHPQADNYQLILKAANRI